LTCSQLGGVRLYGSAESLMPLPRPYTRPILPTSLLSARRDQ
jgi:hypothetical protein